MVKEFNSLEEIQQYYDEESNTYVFKENNKFIDIVNFNFDLEVDANIIAYNVRAFNIRSLNIKVYDMDTWNIDADYIEAHIINSDDINAKKIKAWDIKASYINSIEIKSKTINAYYINAKYIDYDAFCFAYSGIICNTIKSAYKNAKHFVLNGTIEIKGA